MDTGPLPESEAYEIATRALGSYGLPDRAELRPVRLAHNAVFEVVVDGRRFALRVHRPSWRSSSQIRAELDWLRFLARDLRGSAVSVPEPVPTRDGDLPAEITTATGSYVCSLLTWVTGSALRPGSGLGPRAAELLGEAHGRLHLAGERFDPGPESQLPTWNADGLFGAASPYAAGSGGPEELRAVMPRDDFAIFERVAGETQTVFDRLSREGRDGRGFGLTHNDFILGNCHFARVRRGWQIGVLDFDECGWGWFLFDMGAIIGNLADFPRPYLSLRASFFEGYRRIRPLPLDCEEDLPLMMAARHASQCLWTLGMWHVTGDDAWLERQLRVRADRARFCLDLPR